VRLNQVSRTFFERLAAISSGQLASDLRAVTQAPVDPGAVERLSHEAYLNALLRTTCVPTQLKGGHAENALPQLAEAVVNCRLVPDDTTKAVQETLGRIAADPNVEITPTQDVVVGPFSPLRSDVMKVVSTVTDTTWPGITVIPLMETGATDGKWLRLAGIPTYGASAIFIDVDDIRAHGKDERVSEQSFYDGVRFDYQLIKRLATPVQ